MSQQWTPAPGHTREQSAIELTRFLLQKHYRESNAAADESIFDEPFFWFGAAEQEFSVDREEVVGLFRRFVGQVPQCNLTEEDFHATCDFLEEIHPAFIHVFPYSRRAGTPAAVMPDQVPESVKTARVEVLERMCGRLHGEFCAMNSGREEEVLFENRSRDGKMTGYTRNYIKVERPYDRNLIGKVVRVTLP